MIITEIDLINETHILLSALSSPSLFFVVLFCTVYYVTHQFFINSRAIYLVVFNLKDRGEDISRVDYWLQSMCHHSPPLTRGAPIHSHT